MGDKYLPTCFHKKCSSFVYVCHHVQIGIVSIMQVFLRIHALLSSHVCSRLHQILECSRFCFACLLVGDMALGCQAACDVHSLTLRDEAYSPGGQVTKPLSNLD